MGWSSAGVVTDPSDDDILADTGALGVGVTQFGVIVDMVGGSTIVIEHRNTGNTANLHSQRVPVSYEKLYFTMPFAPGVNERVRLRVETGFTGTVQASLFT